VVAVLVELATPDVSLALPPPVVADVEPAAGAPIELVPPDVAPDDVPLLAVPLSVVPLPVLPLMALVLPGAAVLPVAGVVVLLDELVDVAGTAASSRLVQAPRETAATRASAAHEVRDAFIRELLEDLLNREGQLAPPRHMTLGTRTLALVGPGRTSV
jgi:hypothetical protein